MPTKKMKPMVVWVTRDKWKADRFRIINFYNVHFSKGWAKLDMFGDWTNVGMSLLPESFEKHFFKIKPGEGPVEAEITIKRIT